MDVKLIAVTPKGTRKEFALASATTTLGRQPDCDLKLPIEKISRQHCQFMVEGNKVSVKDLGSANGTFVNGQKIAQKDLQPGDVVSLAEAVNFLVQIDGKPAQFDESKLRPGSSPAPAPAAKAPPAAKPAQPAATKPAPKPAAKPAAPAKDDTDNLLGESFFKDMDEDDE